MKPGSLVVRRLPHLGFGIGALFMLTLDYLAPHLRFGQVEFHGHLR